VCRANRSSLPNTNKNKSKTKAASSETTGGPAVGAEGKVKARIIECTICGTAYKEKIGISIHQHSAHSDLYHQEHQVADRQKTHWSVEEANRLACQEAAPLADGVPPRKVNQELGPLNPRRNNEMIKGERRKQEYKDAVKAELARLKTRPVMAPVDESVHSQ